MSLFRIELSLNPATRLVEFYAYNATEGQSKIRDENHCNQALHDLTEQTAIKYGHTPEGNIPLFRCDLDMVNARGDRWQLKRADFQRLPECTNRVATVGMEIFHSLKRSIRKAQYTE